MVNILCPTCSKALEVNITMMIEGSPSEIEYVCPDHGIQAFWTYLTAAKAKRAEPAYGFDPSYPLH